MAVSPAHVTLSADTETELVLDRNYGEVEVTLTENPARTFFNATDTPIGTVGGNMDGNHILTSTLVSKVVADGTAGSVTKVRLRSVGTPTVQVMGL